MLEGKCGKNKTLWLGIAIPSAAVDFVILLLPLPKVWGLQVTIATKAGISLVFALGYWYILLPFSAELFGV